MQLRYILLLVLTNMNRIKPSPDHRITANQSHLNN